MSLPNPSLWDLIRLAMNAQPGLETAGTPSPEMTASPPAKSASSNTTDPSRIAQAQAGERAAQDALLREHQDVWYRFAWSLLRDEDLAQDAAQETGLRVLTGLSKYRGDSAFQTWSLGITLNVCRTVRRRRRRLRFRPSPEPESMPTRSTGEARGAGLGPDTQDLPTMLAVLPDRQREAIVLRHLEELSVQDTARVMNCKAGTVKALTHQGLAALRQHWGDRP